MTGPTDPRLDEQLRAYYQTSTRYRDDLVTHDERFLEPFLLLVERYLPLSSRILDIGCGTGLSARLLRERGYDATGVDLSPLFLTVEKKNSPDTPLLAANALQLPFADVAFDAVVAFEFVEHIPNVPAMLDEMLRVVKNQGYIIFHSPNLISPYLPAFDLLRLILGKEGRPVFAENFSQAMRWLGQNLFLSLQKKVSSQPQFTYRQPDLTENRIGGDADSVYLASQIDLSKYLKNKGCTIHQLAHAMSWKNKIITAVTPSFAPYMGLVARKGG